MEPWSKCVQQIQVILRMIDDSSVSKSVPEICSTYRIALAVFPSPLRSENLPQGRHLKVPLMTNWRSERDSNTRRVISTPNETAIFYVITGSVCPDPPSQVTSLRFKRCLPGYAGLRAGWFTSVDRERQRARSHSAHIELNQVLRTQGGSSVV